MLTIYIIANRTIKVYYIEGKCCNYGKMEFLIDADEEYPTCH